MIRIKNPVFCLESVSRVININKSVATRSSGLSLGASGAICSDTQLSIIFLPMITFSAGLGIRMMMVADCALYLSSLWSDLRM